MKCHSSPLKIKAKCTGFLSLLAKQLLTICTAQCSTHRADIKISTDPCLLNKFIFKSWLHPAEIGGVPLPYSHLLQNRRKAQLTNQRVHIQLVYRQVSW